MNKTKIEKLKCPNSNELSSSALPPEIYFEFCGDKVRVADHMDGTDPEMQTLILFSIEADQRLPQVQILNSLSALGVSLERRAVWEFCG